jgi:hypothetical protein
VLAELPGRGEKVLAAMHTAEALIAQIVSDGRGLRLAESAAYNVREALDAVVTGIPATDGGQRAVLTAWAQYELEVAQPGNDHDTSLQALTDVLRQMEQDQDRSSYRTRQLLTYLRDKSGVDPLPGDHDPVKEYGALRGEASQSLHSQAALEDAVALYDRAVAWFIWMFTPPDAIAQAVRALAAEPWRGTAQLAKLRDLASNQHHLRLFLTQLADPAWLNPLRETGLVRPPDPDVAWPAAGLVDGLGRTHPEDVATLLDRLVRDCKSLPGEQQLTARFELLRVAAQLGAAGHRVVARVVAEHPDAEAVRAIGTGVVAHADPADQVVQDVARAVLRGEPGDHDRYYYELVLRQLEAGVTADNVAGRVRMVAVKAREVAEHPQASWERLDNARLTADLNDSDRTYLVILSHYLARLITKARSLGVPSTELLHWTRDITGEIGERITSHILAGANDIAVNEKSSMSPGDSRPEPAAATIRIWSTTCSPMIRTPRH